MGKDIYFLFLSIFNNIIIEKIKVNIRQTVYMLIILISIYSYFLSIIDE